MKFALTKLDTTPGSTKVMETEMSIATIPPIHANATGFETNSNFSLVALIRYRKYVCRYESSATNAKLLMMTKT